MHPSRADIDSAKSAIIMAVAGCPVERQVSFSEIDNGTDTGRLEVRQILKGYKGIDEAIREMNRDVKYKILNDKPMSKDEAHKALGIDQDDDGELSFAKSGYRSGAQTPGAFAGLAGSAPVTADSNNSQAAHHAATNLKPVEVPSTGRSSTDGSRDVLSDKEALAAGPAAVSSSVDADKPPLGRLNTLQREELAKVPAAGTSTGEGSAPALAAAIAAPAASTERKPSISRKPVPAVDSESKIVQSGHSRQNSAGTESLASRLRAEIEERARATKEARAAGHSGSTNVGPMSEAAVSDSTSKVPVAGTAFATSSGGNRLPAFEWEKEQDRSRAATPKPTTAPEGRTAAPAVIEKPAAPATTVQSSKAEESAFRGPVTAASAAAAVAALPDLERRERQEAAEASEPISAPTNAAASDEKPSPLVMTDTIPEPNAAVAAAIPTSPAGASEATETSKPSAFTEEFDKTSAPTASEATSTAETTERAVPAVGAALGSNSNKEAPKLSYASQPSNRRESKSGGFLSGLFRRKSRSGKPDSGSVSVPRKSEEATRSEAAPAVIVSSASTLDQPNETKIEPNADSTEAKPATLSRVPTSGSNASAKNAGRTVTGTLPDDVEKAAEEAVASSNPVIESEIGNAGVKDAEHPLTEEGHKDASIIDKLEEGPDEIVAEPSQTDELDAPQTAEAASVKTRGSSVTAEHVDTSALAVGTSYREDEPSHTTAPAGTADVPARSATQKKKNRFSSFFSKFKSDASPIGTQSYQRDVSNAGPITATKNVATETDGAAVAPSSGSILTADETIAIEPEEVDNRSITAIAASVPLPEPTYTPEVQAKRDRIRRKKEHQERVRLEKERQERELLAKRDRILNAYTGKQGMSCIFPALT